LTIINTPKLTQCPNCSNSGSH